MSLLSVAILWWGFGIWPENYYWISDHKTYNLQIQCTKTSMNHVFAKSKGFAVICIEVNLDFTGVF